MMASRVVRFNSYLLLTLVALCAVGCKSMKKKDATTFRLHQEVNPDGGNRSSAVPVYRASPLYVNVENAPFITEAHIAKASVIEALGSFQIMVQFDRRGTWLLEQYTSAHRGRRIGIFSQFGDARWLAAPVMNKRISDGALVFTPDASREEADRIVLGLNNVAKEAQKGVP
jgi:preprotein translocase subunit SecD